jgi:hypothetical protein
MQERCKPCRVVGPNRGESRLSVVLTLALVAGGVTGGMVGARAAASDLIVAGPSWSSTSNQGYTLQNLPEGSVSHGFGVAYGDRVDAGSNKGVRGLRLTPSGAVELGTLGTSSGGNTSCYVTQMNDAGLTVGYARWYAGTTNLGNRAVRWAAGSTTAERLGDIGTNTFGFSSVVARGVNAAGTVVGEGAKYAGGQSRGERAIRWNAGTTIATELGHLGTDVSGTTYAVANDVNDAGLAVGDAARWGSSTPGGGDDGGGPGTTGYIGQRAVRWLPGTTAAVQLGHLGVNNVNSTNATARGVNSDGVTYGWAMKYGPGGTTSLGRRAVRWDAGVTAATELGTLGTSATGAADADAWAINDAGTIVGRLQEFGPAGALIGESAVRWDAGSTAAIALARLGSNAAGGTDSVAWDVNNAGWIAGDCHEFDGAGVDLGQRAVVWTPSGEVIDLNGYLDAGGPWVNLYTARGISASDWVSGIGLFDADGPGGDAAYYRVFIMRVPAISACIGDADHNKVVTFADITTTLSAWGAAGAPFRSGDADGDRAVNFGDITAILSTFGASCP